MISLKAQEKFLKQTRRDYLKYLKSPKWMRFAKAAYTVPWWNLLAQFVIHTKVWIYRDYYLILGKEGRLMPAMCLMRNVGLHKKGTVAPALMMGTFDFSRKGFNRLGEIMIALEDARQAGTELGAMVDETMADEEFQEFRRRPLPAELDPSGTVFLYDCMMRWDDLPDIEPGIPFPAAVMIGVTQPHLDKYVFAILPKKMTQRAIKFLDTGK